MSVRNVHIVLDKEVLIHVGTQGRTVRCVEPYPAYLRDYLLRVSFQPEQCGYSVQERSGLFTQKDRGSEQLHEPLELVHL